MRRHQWIFVLIFAGFMAMLPATQGMALETMDLEGDSQLTVYGWLRNNLGVFTDDIDYADNGNDLATCRTWLRTYLDYKISDNVSAMAAIQFVHEPTYQIEHGSISSNSRASGHATLEDGREYSEYYRVADILREAYIDWKVSDNHSFRIGRQIVIWGESLTTRVGDVIHPEDTRFTFAFANLEDTRIPLWIVKGNHQFAGISSGLEWVISPNIEDEQYRVNRTASFATVVPLGGSVLTINSGQRFGIHPEDRPGGGPPIGEFPGIPTVTSEYPDNDLKHLRYGFRTSTFLGGYEFGAIYYHTQNYNPVVRVVSMATGQFNLFYKNENNIGAYFNKDAAIGVVRGEAIYIPDKNFNTFDVTDNDRLVREAYVKYSLTWDAGGSWYFDWHKSAPFDFAIDHVGEWVPDNEDLQYVVYQTEMDNWVPSFNARLATNWFYNKLSTEIIAGWTPRYDGGLLMPAVKYMPTWYNNMFSFEVKYIRIFARSNYEGIGLLQQKDMLLLTTQLNF